MNRWTSHRQDQEAYRQALRIEASEGTAVMVVAKVARGLR